MLGFAQVFTQAGIEPNNAGLIVRPIARLNQIVILDIRQDPSAVRHGTRPGAALRFESRQTPSELLAQTPVHPYPGPNLLGLFLSLENQETGIRGLFICRAR